MPGTGNLDSCRARSDWTEKKLVGLELDLTIPMSAGMGFFRQNFDAPPPPKKTVENAIFGFTPKVDSVQFGYSQLYSTDRGEGRLQLQTPGGRWVKLGAPAG